jgi:hypothetical protein
MMKRLVGFVSVALLSVPAFAQAPQPGSPPAKPTTPAAAPAAGAAAAQPPAMPQGPASELDAMKHLVGKWTCDDMSAMGLAPGTAPVKVKTEYEFKPALDKNWYWGSFTEKKQKDFPGFHGEAYAGYDAVQKKYIFLGFDNLGGWVNLSTTSGGDTLAWTGEGHLGPQSVPIKYTWTKKSDKEMTFTLELQQGGNWLKASEATCKKK